VTTKSKSEMQQSLMDVSVERRDEGFKEHPNIGDLIGSKIEAKESSKQCSMGKRLMIIELRNTSKSENYL